MSTWQDNVAVLVPQQARYAHAGRRHAVSVQGTLALELGPVPLPVLAPPEPTEPSSALSGADVVAVSPARRTELQRWARTFAQASVEVVLGDRPASQLVRWTTPEVHQELSHRSRVIAQATVRRGQARRSAVRPQVGPVRACFLQADVAEVCFAVRYGARHRALAARLEERAGRWQCTVLEFG